MTSKLSRRLTSGVVAAAVLVLGTTEVAAAHAPAATATPLQAESVTGPVVRDAAFNGVDCPSATLCIAVGRHLTGTGTAVAMAQRWNGTAWTAMTVPEPSGARAGYLSAISCSSARDCLAVGRVTRHGGSQTGLAVRWDGSSWSLVGLPSTPTPTRLRGVACPSASFCVAVGRAAQSTGTAPLTEIWTGGAWHAVVHEQVGTTVNSYEAVACASAADCLAVGDTDSTFDTGGGTSLASHWDGSSWTQVAVPIPAGASDDRLRGVACPDVQACVAVGGYRPSSGSTRGLVERWNGTALHPAASTSADTLLQSVACTSVSSCSLAGAAKINSTTNASTLAAQWDGGTITRRPTPNGAADVNSYAAVSCTTALACVAVGQSDDVDLDGAPATPLAATWDGTAWSASAPRTFGTVVGRLAAVSCRTAGRCLAVGYSLAYRRTASGWTPTSALPVPSSDTFVELTGVSCPRAGECLAVGSWNDELARAHAYAARWNGSSWTLVLPPEGGALAAVSCPSADSCVAIGSDSGAPQAQSWNGTSWTLTSLPSKHQFFEPEDLSCTSSTACTAVGESSDDDGSFNSYSTVYRRSGTTWTLQRDALAAKREIFTTDVACATATSCVSVSSRGSAGTPFAQVWTALRGPRWISPSRPV